MALTAAQRKANQRARDRGQEEPFKSVSREEIAGRLDQHEKDLAWAQEQDTKETFYGDECRPCVDLLAIYEGTDILDKESEEEEISRKKKKEEKKDNRPNPSQQKISIKAITYLEKIDLGNGAVAELTFPIEPACWKECDHKECGREHRKEFEVDEVVSFQRWLSLRAKARKDLLWLGRVLGKGFFHSTHQYVCDQFVKKNFEGMYFPGYTVDDFHEMMAAQKRYANIGTDVVEDGVVETREMMLLEQRGAYKSTIDGVDCVQWIINCPDIRIMVMTAFRQLAKKRAKEIKRYFYLPNKKVPTTFQMLFPEFITTGVAGRSDGPLECPARNVDSKEDTLWVTSMESSATGDHCDLLKGDDIVDPKNSADEEMRAELKFRFDSAKTDLLDPWGFVDQTGTRYFTDDMYGTRQVANAETKRVSPFRYSCRGAFILSAEDQILYNNKELSLREIIEQRRGKLTFPYNRGWAKLRNILDEKDERNFKNQQMNEATDASDLSDYVNHFTHESLIAHLYPKDSAPKFGDVWILWDLAYSQSSTSDFSVGVCVKISRRLDNLAEVVVIDAVHGKWKSSELSTNMAMFYAKHPEAKGILVEKINGLEWLLKEVTNAGRYYNIIDLTSKIASFEIDNSRHAKRNRIKNLELLMFDNRLHFVSDARWNDECFKQFEMFTGEPSTKSRKDDFPDAISFVFQLLPKDAIRGGAEDTEKTRKEREEKRQQEFRKGMHDRMFAPNNYQPPQPAQEAPRQPAQDPRTAQLMKILPPAMRRRG